MALSNRRFLIVLLLLALFTCVNAQAPAKATLSDEFANLFCTDELRSRIDNFFARLSDSPGSTGYVVVSPDARIPGRAAKIVQTIRNHTRFRNFDAERIRFIDTAPGDWTHFRFWIVPAGAATPDVSRVEQAAVKLTTLFDSSGIAAVKNGEVEFGEGYDSGEPCDLGLQLDQFAEALRADERLTAYLVASAGKRREVSRVRTALRLTVNVLARSYKVPVRRIRTIYAGQLGESAMQLWLVPAGGKVPRYRQGTLEF